MIKLTDKYYVDFDSSNIILKEKCISKKTGKDTYISLGYFLAFDELTNCLVSKCYMKKNNDELRKLADIEKAVDDFKKEITDKIKILAQDDSDFKKCCHSKRKENQV